MKSPSLPPSRSGPVPHAAFWRDFPARFFRRIQACGHKSSQEPTMLKVLHVETMERGCPLKSTPPFQTRPLKSFQYFFVDKPQARSAPGPPLPAPRLSGLHRLPLTVRLSRLNTAASPG